MNPRRILGTAAKVAVGASGEILAGGTAVAYFGTQAVRYSGTAIKMAGRGLEVAGRSSGHIMVRAINEIDRRTYDCESRIEAWENRGDKVVVV